MVFSVHRIVRHVYQRVMHPTHIPFHSESQAPEKSGTGHRWPRRGFFGNGLHIRVSIDLFIELSQKGNGLQIFSSAILVGNPFAFFS